MRSGLASASLCKEAAEAVTTDPAGICGEVALDAVEDCIRTAGFDASAPGAGFATR